MLPPVRHRTQMGDILSWAGGRAESPSNPANYNPAAAPQILAPMNQNQPQVVGMPPQFAFNQNNNKPSYPNSFSNPNPNRDLNPQNNRLQQIVPATQGAGNVLNNRQQLQPVPPPNPPSGGGGPDRGPEQNRNINYPQIQQNADFLAKPFSEDNQQLSHDLAVQNTGLQNQIFSLERVCRLLTDRVTFLENKASNVSQQLDERARTDAEILRKVQLQVRDIQEGQSGFVKDVAGKLTQHEEQNVRSERDQAAVRESVRGLQNDFRDFAVQSVYRQRQETEQLIKNQFAKHQFQENDARAELKRQQEELAEGISRVNNTLEDLDTNAAAFKQDARARIVNLENAILCKEGDVGESGEPKLGGFAFREHVEQLRAQVAQMAKDFTENVIENENEKKIRNAVIREYEEKIANLNTDLSQQKQELLTLFEQRQEVMQSKIEMEKHEILAKQAEMREELQGVDSLNAVSISDIELKTMNNLDLFKKREEAERDALRQVVDSKLNQVVGQIARTETLRQDGLTVLYEKIDDFQNKQLETVKEIRGEVHENIRDVQTLFKDEMRHRMETERKMTESVREVVKNLSQSQATAFEQLSDRIRLLSETLGESRKESSERAERMSRYVDEVVAKWRLDYGRQCELHDTQMLQLEAKLKDLFETVERTRNTLDDKITSSKNHVLEKQDQASNHWQEQLLVQSKRFEERQYKQEQYTKQEFDHMKQKTDRQNSEFDEAIAGVHRAILGLSKDKSLIGANIVVPLPSWDQMDSARSRQSSELPYGPKKGLQPDAQLQHGTGAATSGGGAQPSFIKSNFHIPAIDSSPASEDLPDKERGGRGEQQQFGQLLYPGGSGASGTNNNAGGGASSSNGFGGGDTLQLSNTFENLEIPRDQLSPFGTGGKNTPPDEEAAGAGEGSSNTADGGLSGGPPAPSAPGAGNNTNSGTTSVEAGASSGGMLTQKSSSANPASQNKQLLLDQDSDPSLTDLSHYLHDFNNKNGDPQPQKKSTIAQEAGALDRPLRPEDDGNTPNNREDFLVENGDGILDKKEDPQEGAHERQAQLSGDENVILLNTAPAAASSQHHPEITAPDGDPSVEKNNSLQVVSLPSSGSSGDHGNTAAGQQSTSQILEQSAVTEQDVSLLTVKSANLPGFGPSSLDGPILEGQHENAQPLSARADENTDSVVVAEPVDVEVLGQKNRIEDVAQAPEAADNPGPVTIPQPGGASSSSVVPVLGEDVAATKTVEVEAGERSDPAPAASASSADAVSKAEAAVPSSTIANGLAQLPHEQEAATTPKEIIAREQLPGEVVDPAAKTPPGETASPDLQNNSLQATDKMLQPLMSPTNNADLQPHGEPRGSPGSVEEDHLQESNPLGALIKPGAISALMLGSESEDAVTLRDNDFSPSSRGNGGDTARDDPFPNEVVTTGPGGNSSSSTGGEGRPPVAPGGTNKQSTTSSGGAGAPPAPPMEPVAEGTDEKSQGEPPASTSAPPEETAPPPPVEDGVVVATKVESENPPAATAPAGPPADGETIAAEGKKPSKEEPSPGESNASPAAVDAKAPDGSAKNTSSSCTAAPTGAVKGKAAEAAPAEEPSGAKTEQEPSSSTSAKVDPAPASGSKDHQGAAASAGKKDATAGASKKDTTDAGEKTSPSPAPPGSSPPDSPTSSSSDNSPASSSPSGSGSGSSDSSESDSSPASKKTGSEEPASPAGKK
ncbi:unnamed protein product [Amoebophrya sp. A120]|nr:unnamed protein product [Amoebophrya sp. A120]|eukprot:GSA120T00001157001.1